MIRSVPAALLLVSAAPALAGPAAAQSDPRLVAAVRLAQEGLGDSARSVVGRVLAATPPASTAYPEVLYTIAVVASSVQDKRLYLQRVAVEYSQSDWADDALLQLAQVDYATGAPGNSVQHVRLLLRDYPTSPLRARAALWGARAAFDTRDQALACQWVAAGLATVGDEVELKGQLEFQRERCRAPVVAATPAPATPTPRSAAPAVAPGSTAWLVQVAAFRGRAPADDAVASLKRLDYPAFVARDGDIWRVRAGPFASEAEARAAVGRIKQRLRGEPFVLRGPVP